MAEASEDANSLTEEESTFHTTIERLPTVEVDLSLNRLPSPEPELPTASTTDDEAVESSEQPRLRRWISTLRRRKKQLPAPAAPPDAHQWNFGSRPSSPMKRVSSKHKYSNSYGSSLGFVTAVRSATATIASASIATVSRRNTKWRRGHQRSSLLSGSDLRPSLDSQRSVLDEAAKQRSRKRRAKLEELIRSEESYVADVKSLSNAYSNILGHQLTTFHFARSSAQKNITEILRLHNELLGNLHSVVPFAEHDQRAAKAVQESTMMRSHTRWHSVDVVPSRSTPVRSKLASIRNGRRSLNISRSSAEDDIIMCCSPQIVAKVARTFASYVGRSRFAVYEDYGANYELVQRDVDEIQRGILAWPDFDRAIEALSAHVNPVKSREANRKKAMTVKDLLIKPIQRLPRYELMFSDLCKVTPVCDDPDSNAAIQDLLVRLNDVCRHMNEAKDNPARTRILETTCLLGDRLSFANQVPRSVFLQLLGQVHLCGCFYIAYRSKDRIKGMYVVCVLFESTLLLATAEDDQLKYSTLAGIPLANTTIVECDNGKGLQCYTAPYSWKLVFEHSARMYEVILTACSALEAEVWRQNIAMRIESQAQAVAVGSTNLFELHSPLVVEMRSVGKAFGKPGSFVRRMSVHRTATVGPMTDLNQVIIKNTQSAKEAVENASSTPLQIPRSQSVATPSHVQTLAPRRAERVRLEGLLSDVWTKDLLPYPGMTPRRSDPIRASANHVIRKFSMASITSNFSSSKRSASYTSISQPRKEDVPPPKAGRGMARDHRGGSSKPSRPPLVDFHNAPEAFLPTDFELQDPAAKRKKSALRTFTLTMERPFSPLLGNENKPSGLRRAQSVRDVSETRPAPRLELKEEKPPTPVYSVVQERAKTPAKLHGVQNGDETITGLDLPAKTPRKSKSKNKLLRLFG
ncbi:hypothetical protein LTR37_020413 [Vermiconidia calcicola]|uniref:Uncharacterized protein n=1 Tax=Vermiconidia calcicola TaxID=1690605 RepID=A0ACC3MCP7_9PEZI|nr:hypothetical protein LTR37_020413 [Vermiconidia calcicola]